MCWARYLEKKIYIYILFFQENCIYADDVNNKHFKFVYLASTVYTSKFL